MKKYIILALLFCAVTASAETLWVKPTAVLPEVVPPPVFDLDKAALKAEILALDSFTVTIIQHILAKHGAKGTIAQAKEVIRRLEEANKFIKYDDLYLIQYPPPEPVEP